MPYPNAMTVKLNHTIVHSVDKRAAAEFFAGVFGLPAPKRFYDFLDVEVGNEVTLAFLDADGMEIQVQHYAFLVSEKEFDRSSAASRSAVSTTGPIPAARRKAGSTVTSAAAASTSSTRAATCSRSSRDPMETMRAAAGDGAAYNGPLAIVGGKKGENHEKARYRNSSCGCTGVFGFHGGRSDRAGQEGGQRRCAADHQGRRGKRQAGCDRDHLRAGRRKQHVQGGDSRRARPGGRDAAAHLRRRQEGNHRLQDRAGEKQRAGPRIHREEHRQNHDQAVRGSAEVGVSAPRTAPGKAGRKARRRARPAPA